MKPSACASSAEPRPGLPPRGETDVLQRRAREQGSLLRHPGEAIAHLDRVGGAHAPRRPPRPDPTADHRSAATGGRPSTCPRPTARQEPRFRRTHGQAETLQRRQIGTARMGEVHRRHRRTSPNGGCGRATGLAGGAIAGTARISSSIRSHSPGGLLHIAPAFAQRADGPGGEDRQRTNCSRRPATWSRRSRPAPPATAPGRRRRA